MNFENLPYLIVGAGFYGSVLAERIASQLGERVLVIDKRNHIGGNSFSYQDQKTGIEVHKYGSHIFHTSNPRVWDYLKNFTTFNNYRHRVWTQHQDELYSMPINLTTINRFFKKRLTPLEAQSFVQQKILAEKIETPKNLEQKAISLIGRELFEAFVKNYTQKQWDLPLTELPPEIIARLPVRFNLNDFYFSDTFEGIPSEGYGSIFKKILNHPLIDVQTNVDFFEIQNQIPESCRIVYTGPIDRFFKNCFGPLQWRTTDFEVDYSELDDVQGTAVINFADAHIPMTRTHEFKHFQPEKWAEARGSILYREYSRAATENDIPYYPVNTPGDKEKLKQYQKKAQTLKNIHFGGRLGHYVYIDMHQAIAMALNFFDQIQQKKELLWNPS